MTDAYRFDESSTEQAIAYAKIYAGENYSPAMETVLKVAFSEKRNLPTFRLKSSDTTPGMVLLLGEYDRRGRLLQGGRLAAADKDKRQFRKQFQQQGQAGHSHRKMVPQVLEASGSI